MKMRDRVDKLRKIIREEVRRLFEQEVVIETGGKLVDGMDFISRDDFERRYVNDKEPPSTKFRESVETLIKLDNMFHFLVGQIMDHDVIDHGLGDRVPDHEKWVSHEAWEKYIDNLENSDVGGDPGESFLELNKRLFNTHARIHALMAQHVRHHVDMEGNDSVTER